MLQMQNELNLFLEKDGSQAKVNSSMEQKYTASEWAQIEGGHTVETSVKSQYSFVRDLNESKMFRTRQQATSTNTRDMADFAFLNILTLYILYNEYEYAPLAKNYAAETIKYRNFDTYRQSANDLYVALNNIKSGNSAADRIQVAKLNIPDVKLRQFLVQMSQGQPIKNAPSFMLQLERGMDIQESNYRSIRRLVQEWPTLTNAQKSLVITRLVYFYRTKAIRSELFQAIKQLAAHKGWEIKDTGNPEKGSALGKVAKLAAVGVGGYMLGRAIGNRIFK